MNTNNREEMLKKDRIVILQAMVDTYLNKHGKSSSKILFDNETEKDEYGNLTKAQYQLLHFYLIEEFQTLGLNLNEEIKKHGEISNPGVLTNFEINELNRRADEIIMVLATVQKRKKELYTK